MFQTLRNIARSIYWDGAVEQKNLAKAVKVIWVSSASLIVSVPALLTLPYLDVSPLFNIGFGVLITMSTAMMLRSLQLLARNRAGEQQTRLTLQQEVAALNQHAIVSLTDQTGHICFVNQKFIEATGYAAEEIIGKHPSYLYADETKQDFAKIITTLKNGGNWEGETVLRRRDGRIIITQTTVLAHLNAAKELIGTVAVRTDITQVRLASAERDTVASLHNLSDPIAMIDPDTLNFIYMNEAALSLTGWTQETFMFKSVSNLPFDTDPRDVRKELRTLFSGKEHAAHFSLRLKGRDFSVDIQKIVPEFGGPRLFVIMRDVTDALELERVKHDFIANVSHELRTPLTAIKGALGLVLSGAAGEPSPKARSLLDIAHRNADRLVLIVNDILDLEKIAAGKMDFSMVVGDLRETITESVQSVQAYADQFGVTIEVEQPDEPVMARFDGGRILQVLTNLISNACKFSMPGSSIKVQVTTDGAQHLVAVRDQGMGIPATAIETIFDRFSQAGGKDRRAKGGTGLGLSIVKAIVEKHGGQVSLESTEGVGTTVTFNLRGASYRFQEMLDAAKTA